METVHEKEASALLEAGTTRERLLHAAGRVFAEKGYQTATAKEICELAGVNLAAVNYHFGSKEKLYREVLTAIHERFFPYEEFARAVPEGASPTQQLEAVVETFLSKLLAPSREVWAVKLMAREILDPSPFFESVVREEIGPKASILRAILSKVLGFGEIGTATEPGRCDPLVDFASVCTISLCLSMYKDRELNRVLYPGACVDASNFLDIKRRAKAFILGGVAALARAEARGEPHPHTPPQTDHPR